MEISTFKTNHKQFGFLGLLQKTIFVRIIRIWQLGSNPLGDFVENSELDRNFMISYAIY